MFIIALNGIDRLKTRSIKNCPKSNAIADTIQQAIIMILCL